MKPTNTPTASENGNVQHACLDDFDAAPFHVVSEAGKTSAASSAASSASVVTVSEEDAAGTREQISAIMRALAALGAEEERHASARAGLLGHITAARSEYEFAVRVLTRKYIHVIGDFEYRPEIGAFVALGMERKDEQRSDHDPK